LTRANLKVEIKYLLINSSFIHSNNKNNNNTLIAYNNLSSPALLVTSLLRSFYQKQQRKKNPKPESFQFQFRIFKATKKATLWSEKWKWEKNMRAH